MNATQPACLPRIPRGTVVYVHLTGVLPADETNVPCTVYQVHGARLDPTDPEEGEDGRLILAPRGWEYNIGRIEGAAWNQRYHEYGWITEAELLAKGYGDSPADEDDASDLRW